MPEKERTNSASSVRNFFSDLHFSGKVIIGSVLFGFGLLLVGAILFVIATGAQKNPPFEKNSEEKKTPMTFVGPGVMGVGSFFVVVGTIMCFFETRIHRRRRRTENDSLINAEIVPTGNVVTTSMEYKDDFSDQEAGDKNLKDIEETRVKTVNAKCDAQGSMANVEKAAPESLEKDNDKELSSSIEIEQTMSFSASVYVDALDSNHDDGYEEEFATESTQFSTPPESKSEEVQTVSFECEQRVEYDNFKSLYPVPTTQKAALVSLPKDDEKSLPLSEEKVLPIPKEKDISLPLTKEKDISLPMTEENGGSFPMQEKESSVLVPEGMENLLSTPKVEVSLPETHDSDPSKIQADTKQFDLTKEILHQDHSPENPAEEIQSDNVVSEERKEESSQEVASTNATVENSADSDKVGSVENAVSANA